jgi:hypothetical protein
MHRFVAIVLFSTLSLCSVTDVYAQESRPTTENLIENLKTIVVATEAKPDSEIAVPPATSVRFYPKGEKNPAGADAVDLPAWLRKEEALNGLESAGLLPWHIVVTYDQFDEDGDNVHSGVYEEYWAGPKKYKRVYKSDNLNQTDYATDKGLHRQGDQQWPDRAQTQVRAEIVAPFYYGASLEGFHGRNVERILSGYKLQCVLIEKDTSTSDPTQYCLEPDSSILRYSRGLGWFQTVYNQIVAFQGRNIGREVDVTDGGKAYLKLHVDKIEAIPHVEDAMFTPPSDVAGPFGDRISGVVAQPAQAVNMSIFPKWPASLRGQHFAVTVQIVIGKDGHVIKAHALSGPRDGYKACEDAVRKWIFKPFLVLDKPVEVEQKVECSVTDNGQVCKALPVLNPAIRPGP